MRFATTATRSLHRYLSSTPSLRTPIKLPFEKPLFESPILRDAAREDASYKRLEVICNAAVILAGASAMARLGYYVVYGKEGGAAGLPPRS